MPENGSPPAAHHRHAHHPTSRDRRWRVFLIAVGVLVVAVLAVALKSRFSEAVADQPIAATAATPTSLAATTVTVSATPTAEKLATTSDVPSTFVDALQQLGIPLDADTGWVVAKGICVRLGQPAQYDQFKMAEGVERLFPTTSDEQAHAFVSMVATSVCHL